MKKLGLYNPAFEHDACGIGVVVDIQGRRSHQTVKDALTVLENLAHRGACGCEANTGDGAGILLQVPHAFLVATCGLQGVSLPEAGEYGVGMLYMPSDSATRRRFEAICDDIARAEGQVPLGWRTVPTIPAPLGKTARLGEPVMRQVFLGRGRHVKDADAFERKLYVVRRLWEKAIRYGDLPGGSQFYPASLSARTIIYKGMLTSEQLAEYYPDLGHPAVESALALVHSRFSTNTFPSWERAHPYRFICHNGEINTLRGNVAWMNTRESLYESDVFGDDLKKILPVVAPDGSDSAMFDNTLELLVLAGRSLPHAMMMMVPEPYAKDPTMSAEKRAFYEYHACLMEPWDGPAAIAFTDGVKVGAMLDRNGLRPGRWLVTKDDRLVLASETGVLDVHPEDVREKGRLQPGKMLLVDTEERRVVPDEELKRRVATAEPYELWLAAHLVALEDLPEATAAPEDADPDTTTRRQQAFGYTTEELRMLMAPMARDGAEALGSMGTDTPLAVLSERPQLLYSYFKQLFAQVTNPPIDAIREEIVTSMETSTGAEDNLLRPRPESCRQILLKSPVLTNAELAKLRHIRRPGFKAETLPILFPVKGGGVGLAAALEALYAAADAAIARGTSLLILSDRGADEDHAAIPALLAVSGLNHHLVRCGTRTRAGLLLESGEPREVHHFALLMGYGAGAINPYLAFDTLSQMIRTGHLPGLDASTAVTRYVKAIVKGVLKVLSKMGISTFRSYCGAQIFEAVGIAPEVIERYFTGTPSRIGGVGLDVVAEEVRRRHVRAFPERGPEDRTLEGGGQYQWRKDGEYHLFNPKTVHLLQKACRDGDFDVFREYSARIDDRSRELATLRGLLELKPAGAPVPIEEVESALSIVRRFKTGAMSYGSISQEAHESLAIAMNRLGGKSNSGEGGEDPSRYVRDANGDSRSSAIKQVASGRFGVTSEYLVSAQEIQIKIAQGAKPGEGGQLPGHKVYPWIAKVRHSTAGVGLISPPPHHDIYSIEDLSQLIYDLKCANPMARVSVKLVAEVGVGTVAAGVAKAKADVVLVSGHDGGTGASPLTAIKHAGVPWELGLAETHQTLVLNDLRSRIVIEADGQLRTGRDVVVAALLGAEEFGFATAPLVALGCVMMRVCHLNTCPVGVATQDPALRKNFTGAAENVVNFMAFLAEEVRALMAQLGFRRLDDMVGRTDCLEMRTALEHWKAAGVDLSAILQPPETLPDVARRCTTLQDHGLDESMDRRLLLTLCEPALERGEPVREALPIRNVHRAVGTMVGSEVTRRHGAKGLADDTIRLHFQGSAGQSFGAFLPPGMTLVLEGDANDYVGKGLSGGRVVVYPPTAATFVPEENILIGNVALYGATSGEMFVRGMAGERFAVRNSGASAVVEAIGDHGCEYMTGGKVVVLGKTGRNFAAGMSGGMAWVLDEAGDFARRANRDMVDLEPLGYGDEASDVRRLVQRHALFTRSERARKVLARWDALLPRFVRVVPRDYKRAMAAIERAHAEGREDPLLAAFEDVAQETARAGGA